MLARDLLNSKEVQSIITISDQATLDDAIAMLAEKNFGAVVVTDQSGALAGILSERDVMRVLNGAPTGFRSTSVIDVMTKNVFTGAPDATLDELLVLMTKRKFRHVPILDDGRLVGLLSIGDVVRWRIRQAENEAAALKDYIAG